MLPALGCEYGRLTDILGKLTAKFLTSGGVRFLQGVAKAERVLLVACQAGKHGEELSLLAPKLRLRLLRRLHVSLRLSLTVSQ